MQFCILSSGKYNCRNKILFAEFLSNKTYANIGNYRPLETIPGLRRTAVVRPPAWFRALPLPAIRRLLITIPLPLSLIRTRSPAGTIKHKQNKGENRPAFAAKIYFKYANLADQSAMVSHSDSSNGIERY